MNLHEFNQHVESEIQFSNEDQKFPEFDLSTLVDDMQAIEDQFLKENPNYLQEQPSKPQSCENTTLQQNNLDLPSLQDNTDNQKTKQN